MLRSTMTNAKQIPELTFIIHARPEAADPNTLAAANALAAPMIGDVNLFLKGSPAEEDFEVEVEIMIAGS